MLFQNFKRHLNYAIRWRHICLRIRSKFDFFLNLKGIVVSTTSTIWEKDKKIPQRPISRLIVDVHLYKIF